MNSYISLLSSILIAGGMVCSSAQSKDFYWNQPWYEAWWGVSTGSYYNNWNSQHLWWENGNRAIFNDSAPGGGVISKRSIKIDGGVSAQEILVNGTGYEFNGGRVATTNLLVSDDATLKISNAVITSFMSINGAVTVSGTLKSNQSSNIVGVLNVNGDVSLSGDTCVSGNVYVKDNKTLTLEGSVYLENAIQSSGVVTLSKDIIISVSDSMITDGECGYCDIDGVFSSSESANGYATKKGNFVEIVRGGTIINQGAVFSQGEFTLQDNGLATTPDEIKYSSYNLHSNEVRLSDVIASGNSSLQEVCMHGNGSLILNSEAENISITGDTGDLVVNVGNHIAVKQLDVSHASLAINGELKVVSGDVSVNTLTLGENAAIFLQKDGEHNAVLHSKSIIINRECTIDGDLIVCDGDSITFSSAENITMGGRVTIGAESAQTAVQIIFSHDMVEMLSQSNAVALFRNAEAVTLGENIILMDMEGNICENFTLKSDENTEEGVTTLYVVHITPEPSIVSLSLLVLGVFSTRRRRK